MKKILSIPNEILANIQYLSELNYHKILLADLNKDTYQIVSMYGFEKPLDKTLSGWFKKFSDESVLLCDREKFRAYTQKDNLKAMMDDAGIDFIFSRKFSNGEFYPAELIILPLVGYSEDNRKCIIFSKAL